MRFIDLSHPIRENMPVYPGTAAPSIVNSSSVAEAGYAEKQLNLHSHTGTHVDSPAHMIRDGMTLDQMPLDRFMGQALLLDCRGLPAIDPPYLQAQQERIGACEFVIFHTGWSRYWGQDKYFRDFPLLTPEAAQILSRLNLKGIGVDVISIDAVQAETFPIHITLMLKNLLIIENLTNLDQIKVEKFTFCCFPLKIHQADGSPVRAVAIVDKL